ncbi:hypothetical protein MLD38_031186 [Melastoma candidum]|uniref:Uncharacterized protein n=1 Tax=Melastoma candidum TaxID=119954 RepID=A0ACB9MNX5_9MYRT|nr:hypothetical protein MLD38_031186 [Melastoma candidum]
MRVPPTTSSPIPPTNHPTHHHHHPQPLDNTTAPDPPPHPPAPDDASTATVPHWDDHVLHTLDWDSIMKDLGLGDNPSNPPPIKSSPAASGSGSSSPRHHQYLDPAHPPQIPFDQGHLPIPPDFEVYFDQGLPLLPSHHFAGAGAGGYGECDGGFGTGGFQTLEDLIQVSDCVDSKNFQFAQAILARLNQRLRTPASGKPIHRAAFYFKEALNTLLFSPAANRPKPSRFSSWPDIIQNIRAYKAFSGVSPVAMFTHFTANQALLEAIASPSGSAATFHVVDFDIGFGGQYASLLKEIAERSESCKSPVPLVRITAVVKEEFAVESRLIKENLTQYANEVKVRVSIDFILVRAFEMISFKAIKFVDGEVLAFHLSPTIFIRLGSMSNVLKFMNDVKRTSPAVVVFVDSEPWVGTHDGGPASFRTNLVNCLEYYATLFESIDAAIGCGSGTAGGGENGSAWGRKIEGCLMQPRIEAAVEGAARRAVPPWREVFPRAGLRGVRMSHFADFQAEMLLGKVQVRGFHVAKQQGELVLCWHDRPLVATSAWGF